VRRGSDKRSSRSRPDMDISSPRPIFLLEKKSKPRHRPAAEIFFQEKIFPESGMQTLVN